MSVDHFLTLFLRTYAVLPVILVGEASSGPTQNRYLHFLKGFNDILAHAVHVRNVRMLADIQSLVDASAEMLREMSLKFRVDVSLFVPGIDKKIKHVRTLLSVFG